MISEISELEKVLIAK